MNTAVRRRPVRFRLLFSTLAIAAMLAGLLGGAVSAQAADGTTLTGTVRLGSASLLPNAEEVTIQLLAFDRASNSYIPLPGAPARSDASGSYRIDSVPIGTYQARVEYSGAGRYLAVLKTDGSFSINGSAATWNFTLADVVSISGRIALGDAASTPPAGRFVVDLFGSQVSVPVDASGRFVITQAVRNSSARIGVRDLTGDSPEWYWPGTRSISPSISFDVGATGRDDIDLIVPIGNGITGVVTDTSGRKLSGISISASREPGSTDGLTNQTSTTSAADGSYRFTGLGDGLYRVYFAPPSVPFVGSSWPGVALGSPLTGVLPLVGGTRTTGIDGVIYANTGISVSPFVTEGRTPGDAIHVSLSRRDGAVWTPVGVDRSGSNPVGFTGLVPGTYRADIEQVIGDRVRAAASKEVTIQEGSGAAFSLFAVRVPIVAAGVAGVDFSGDGNPDVLVRNSGGTLAQYAGSGGGGWAGSRAVGVGWNGFSSVFGARDFSGDGNADVLARTPSGDLYLYRGNGASGFAAAGSRIGSGWNGFDTVFSPGDFDGDGADDVIARTPSGGLYLYRGDGAGGWAGSKAIGSGWNGFSRVFPVGDFDGDSRLDVMAMTPSGALYLYRGDGAGGWLGAKQVGSGWGGFTYVGGVGDFDGDGTSDVVARDLMGRLWLYRGSGTGSWLLASQIGSGWNGLLFVG